MKPRLTPSTAIAVIALIAALGGTAYAAGAFTKQQKKQVEKIATKVFDGRIGGATVKRAATADKATEALRAGEAARADVATKAVEATKVTEVPKATQAARADEATRAATAADVPLLGGKAPANFQNRVGGTCPPPLSIATVRVDGSVSCTSPVQAVRLETGPNGSASQTLANGLRVEAVCGNPANELGSFTLRNVGAANVDATFHIAETTGTTTGGFQFAPGATTDISNASRTRTAVELTWDSPTAITTANVSLFRSQGGTFCEVAGTAMTAIG